MSSSGTSSDAKCVIVCGRPSSEHVERRLRNAADELAVAVGDRHRHLHDVDVDVLGVADRLRAHGLHDARAARDSVATARTWCSVIAAPASQSHSNGGVVNAHTWRPSTKNVTPVAASAGCDDRARSSVGPLT